MMVDLVVFRLFTASKTTVLQGACIIRFLVCLFLNKMFITKKLHLIWTAAVFMPTSIFEVHIKSTYALYISMFLINSATPHQDDKYWCDFDFGSSDLITHTSQCTSTSIQVNYSTIVEIPIEVDYVSCNSRYTFTICSNGHVHLHN